MNENKELISEIEIETNEQNLEDFEFEILEMDNIDVLGSTAISSGSSSCNGWSTCGSSSCSSCSSSCS